MRHEGRMREFVEAEIQLAVKRGKQERVGEGRQSTESPPQTPTRTYAEVASQTTPETPTRTYAEAAIQATSPTQRKGHPATPTKIIRASKGARPPTKKSNRQAPRGEKRTGGEYSRPRYLENPPTTRALVLHAAPQKFKPGTMRRWIEEDNKGVRIVRIRWLLKEGRRGQGASSLVIYMRDPVEVTGLRMGRRLFRTTSYD